MTIEVVDWLKDGEEQGRLCSVGGLGGINKEYFWTEYLTLFPEKDHPYLEALRIAILKRGAFTGEEHQTVGTPLFSDNTIGSFSFRAWGDLLAAIYNTKLGERKWTYIDFYYRYVPDHPCVNGE